MIPLVVFVAGGTGIERERLAHVPGPLGRAVVDFSVVPAAPSRFLPAFLLFHDWKMRAMGWSFADDNM